MDARNPGGQNEKRLWHGTASNNVQNINTRNFNRSYGGVHGTYSLNLCGARGGGSTAQAVEMVLKTRFLGFYKKTQNLKSPNFRFLRFKKP